MPPKSKLPLIIGLILLSAFLIRLVNLNQSFWLDEAAQAMESARPLADQLKISGDFQPPLFHLMVFVFEQFGRSEWWLRLASVIPGILTLWFTYLIGTKYFSRQVGVLAMLLGTLSAYHFYFSQELRPYSLAALFGTMSMYYFLPFLQGKSVKSKLAWGYIISSALALYSMYLTVFLLLTHLLITLIQRRNKVLTVLRSQLLVIVFFIPWLPSFYTQLQTGLSLAGDYVGWSTAVSLPWFKSLPLTFVRFMIGMIRVDPTWPYLLGGALGLLVVIFLLKKALNRPIAWEIFTWLAGPILLAFFVSFIVPVLEPKRLLFCLPALWLLLAHGLSQLKLKPIILASVLGIYSLPLVIHFTDSSLLREDWRTAVSDIEATAPANSTVFFAFPGPFAPYSWYQTGKLDSQATNILTLPDTAYLDYINKSVLTYDRVYVFEYLMDLSDPDRLIFQWLEQNNYRKLSVKDYPGVGFVYVFQKFNSLARQTTYANSLF